METEDDGVVASAIEIVAIEEVDRLLARAGDGAVVPPFSAGELAYARAKSDPARRLAARLAAKRAAVRALGPDLGEEDVEVGRAAHGPPFLRLSSRALERLRSRGGARALVSLTHERGHAAAAVLLVREGA
jgi:holo-[acyl-carrier protein] synthase